MSFPVPRMDPERSQAWVSLLTISHLLPAALDEQLNEAAGLINFEYGILSALNVATNRTLRFADLVTMLKAPPPRVSKAVTRLETRGLVERTVTESDRRAIDVHLTREGRRSWLKATPSHLAFARDTILGAFTPDELTMLAELLDVINRRLDPQVVDDDFPKA